jgi:hypothetical protein
VGQYGNIIEIKACGFIYPISAKRWQEKTNDLELPIIKSKIKVLGFEIDFYVIFIIVPENQNENYHHDFKMNNESFINAINQITCGGL